MLQDRADRDARCAPAALRRSRRRTGAPLRLGPAPVPRAATRAGGGGEEYGGRVEASAARSSLASSVAPLLCDWISATNMSGDPLRDAATSAFLAANPAEAWRHFLDTS